MWTPRLFDFAPVFAALTATDGTPLDSWQQDIQAAISPEKHGNLSKWTDAWNQLPATSSVTHKLNSASVTFSGPLSDQQQAAISETLFRFHPWRKGPFHVFGTPIETEWRSDLKWERLQPHVELRDRTILDVGCGNGYFGWRMLGAGAKLVVGLDPFLLYVMQHEAIKKLAGESLPNFVLPLGDDQIPPGLNLFDTTFSMGVLYHRSSPIEHLKTLHSSLRPQGQLVLETLILEGPERSVLMPEKRYAKMRNVWFIPTIDMLQLWLRRTGFQDIQVIDISETTTREQRTTDWMTFESLPDFLNPADPSLTIEGYPRPVRAILTARRL